MPINTMEEKGISHQQYISQLSIDCVIFGYADEELKVLVPKLDLSEDFWALPSGFIHQDEDIDAAAFRIISSRLSGAPFYFQQFRIFGNANRNNKSFISVAFDSGRESFKRIDYDWITQRFVSIGYFVLVNISAVKPQIYHLDKSIHWYGLAHVPSMIMDHNEMVTLSLKALSLNFDEHHLAYHLMPKEFTMKELQTLYEVVFEKPFARNNFQKKILDMGKVERLQKKYTGAQNKAPYLYSYINH